MFVDILYGAITAVLAALLIGLLFGAFSKTGSTDKKAPLTGIKCSFCGQSQEDVRSLIAGPTVFICDKCVVICADILAKSLPPDHDAEIADRRLATDPIQWPIKDR